MFIKEKEIMNKVKKMALCGLMGSFVLLSSVKVQAAEATITHKHVDGCYEDGVISCEDKVEITTHNEEFNCATCQRVAAARVVVETYSCDYMYFKRELRRIAYCYTCGNVVQSITKEANAKHLRTGKINVCKITEGTVIAKITLTASQSAWTKDNVSLNVTVSEPVSGQSLAPYSYAFSGGSASGSNCIISQNGTYTVTVTGKNGQQASTSIKVSNIDKESPVVNSLYVDKEYPEYESANIVVNAVDMLSGLADKPYSFDGGKTFGSTDKCKITSNGTYSVVVKDKAGNTTVKTLKVACFETKPANKPETGGNTGGNVNTGSGNNLGGNTSGGSGNNTGNNTSTGQTSTKVPVNNQQNSSGEKVTDIEKTGQTSTSSTIKKVENKTESNFENSDRDLQKELLKERLEHSDKKVPLSQIPGMYSSVLKYNAEKEAVPMTLSVINKSNENIYSDYNNEQENLVKSISINEENTQGDGSFAQVSKVVVGIGVLLCIGMVGFLIVFLVKKQ